MAWSLAFWSLAHVVLQSSAAFWRCSLFTMGSKFRELSTSPSDSAKSWRSVRWSMLGFRLCALGLSSEVRAATGPCAYTRSPDGGALVLPASFWSGAVCPGAVRAAAGPCVTQGLANGGALLMPGTGAEHLAGGQPPIGRALHDFGCPDELVSFLPDSGSTSASFGRRRPGTRVARVWSALANPHFGLTREQHHITRSEFASCITSKRWSGSGQEDSKRWGSCNFKLLRIGNKFAAAAPEATCCQQLFFAQ